MQNISRDSGFSLIEIIVVISLITSLGGLVMISSIGQYRGVLFGSERSRLVTLLEHARALSIHGVCDGVCAASVSHGILIASTSYILFQGASYMLRDTQYDALFDRDSHVHALDISEIVFTAQSGAVTTPGDVVLVDAVGTVATVTVSSIGRIIWSK